MTWNVYGSDDLWERFLQPIMVQEEKVVIIKVEEIDEKLKQNERLKENELQGWIELKVELGHQLTSTTQQLALCCSDTLWNNMEFKALVCNLINKSLVFKTKRADIKDKSCQLLVDPNQEYMTEQHEQVFVIKVEKIDEKLADHDSWIKLKQEFGVRLMGRCLVLSYNDTNELLQKKYQSLVAHLKDNSLMITTRRTALKNDAFQILAESVDLGKYKESEILDEEGERELLTVYLGKLIMYCSGEQGDGFLYEYMLPFQKKSEEALKILVFLQERGILKSGRLVQRKMKYDSNDDKLVDAIKKCLGKRYTEQQTTHILNVMQGMRGEVCKFEREMIVGFVDFYHLKDHPEDIPEELDFFTAWHMDHFLTLEQAEKGWWDWNAFAVAMLGLAQVIGGVALLVLTVGAGAQIGSALIVEGINDMVYATIAGLTGTFSWKDYAIQKAISLAVSIATAGIGALASPVKTGVRVGSAARFSMFTKTIAEVAGTFALNVTAHIMSDVILAEAQRQVVDGIIQLMNEKIISKIKNTLQTRLEKVARQSASDDEFCERCERAISKFKLALFDLSSNGILENVDTVCKQVSSALDQNYKAIADNLSKAKSKWAKVVGTGAKAALLASKVY